MMLTYNYIVLLLLMFLLALLAAVVASESEEFVRGHCDVAGRECNVSSLLDDQHILGRRPERSHTAAADGIFVSVKTTAKYHNSRLPLILLTWLQTVQPDQVHIVTDGGEEEHMLQVAKSMGFHVVHSQCPASHLRQALCCKSGVEYEQYFIKESQQHKWFCHFDDDVYVNVPRLADALQRFEPTLEPVYFGRWPLNKDHKEVHSLVLSNFLEAFPNHNRTSYQYATGAAYCISSVLMRELEKYLRGATFEENCDKLRVPDDMLVGTIIGAVLGHKLYDEQLILTHLNKLTHVAPDLLHEKITISYGELKYTGRPVIKNVVTIPDAAFSEEEDHSRFLSYHCLLYPHTNWCKRTARD